MDTDSMALRGLRNANPTNDANEAIRRDDLRFLAVNGYTITVPGIEDYHERFESKYKYRVIEGTTDAISNESDHKLQSMAIEYARSYNLTIRDYVVKQK
jgi:hypothetical protein